MSRRYVVTFAYDADGWGHQSWRAMSEKGAEIAFSGGAEGDHHIIEVHGQTMHAHVGRRTVLVVDPEKPGLYVEVCPVASGEISVVLRGGAA